MSNTSIALGDHFQGFINQQVQSGRYQSASEVMRSGFRLLEIEEQKRQTLIQAFIEGEESGIAEDFDRKAFLKERHESRGLNEQNL